MPLTPATRLGPYEITGSVGAGGMGEVYRARDTRLGRDVAIKVLPATYARDADRLRRFQQEARTAGSLNHPNILTIHDIGEHDGAPYVVSELLEGETLRERLSGGAIPQRKAIDYALHVAHGLAAAHQKGIVHRDLKPENLFILRDGRVKILDFGLAKLIQPEVAVDDATNAPTVAAATEPGVLLGTVGYMSPEQVRGWPVDLRADIFAFGAILSEMLSGRRAFQGGSAVETMNAILREDPSEDLPPALGNLVRHCLEKNPEERFQSAQDLAFALQAISGLSGMSQAPVVAAPRRRAWLVIAGLLVLVVATLAAFYLGRNTATTPHPRFQRVTFRRGIVSSARFAPDGQTIVYAAAWDGNRTEIFSTRAGSTESRPLGLPEGAIGAISSSGEMAILLGTRTQRTLARAPLAGGAPREILERVLAADWSPDGKNLAVARFVEGSRFRLEFPVGKVLYESGNRIYHLRVSPKGDRIAFSEGQGAVQALSVVDLSGNRKALYTADAMDISPPAWHPGGTEIWFSAASGTSSPSIYAVTLSGKVRLVEQGVNGLFLQDIALDGRVLLTNLVWKGGIKCLTQGETVERDLSWLDWSTVADLSSDGRTILFTEGRDGGGPAGAVYLRRTDGSPAVRLGEGYAQALSPDGKWALTLTAAFPPEVAVLPTGAGEPRLLKTEGIVVQGARWFPDGKRVLLLGSEKGHGMRNYVVDLKGGSPRALTPEGVISDVISPDAKFLAVAGLGRGLLLQPTEGGEPRKVADLAGPEGPFQWTADGSAILVRTYNQVPAKIYRVDLASGRRELIKEIVPSDPTGIRAIEPVVVTPDGKSYAYTYQQHLNDLYIADGLK